MGPSSPNELGRPRLRRAPLVPVAAAMIAGILAGRYLPLPLAMWCVTGVAAIAVAVATFPRRHLAEISKTAIGVAVLCAGAANLRLAYFHIPDDHIVTCTRRAPSLATVRGRIVSSPQTARPVSANLGGYSPGPRTNFILRAESIRTKDGYRRTSGLLSVMVKEPRRNLLAGQQVELVGWLSRFRPPRNPGELDLRELKRRKGILARMTLESRDAVIVTQVGEKPWYTRMYWNIRAAAGQHLTSEDSGEGRLVSALVLGKRHPTLKKLSGIMVRAGIAHMLSISGLHLGIFLGFVFLLCRIVAMSSRRSATVVLVVLIAYVLLAEARAPLLRSAVMAAALCLGMIFGRRQMALNSLAVAAIVLLAVDPLQIFSAGFQLSFTIVAGIILFLHPARRLLFGRWLRRRGLMVFRREDRLRRWVQFVVADRLTYAVAMCLVAYLSAAPLVAYHFGLFNPYAPLLSLLLLPFLVAILVPGYISLALVWPMPNLAWQFSRAAESAAGAMRRVVEGIDKLPALSVSLRPLDWWWVWMCYAALLLVAYYRRIPFGRIPAACALAIVAATAVVSQLPAPRPDAAELNMLAVGDGQCVLLRTPSGQTYLIDAGTISGFDVYEYALAPFVRRERLPSPRAAFISHANTDHYGAIAPAMRDGWAKKVYLNDYFGREEYSAPGVITMMDLFRKTARQRVRLRAGDVVRLDERTSVSVLWPPVHRRDGLSINNTSLVLRITCDGKSVLLPGDLDADGQAVLAKMPERITSDVLVLPHHGGWENQLPAFFDAVSPRIVLVSTSHDPKGPATSPAAARFYNRIRTNHRYYSTARNGWIRVRFGASGIDVKTMR